MRNWTIKDAVAAIQNGKDTEAIKEIAKHFPVFFMAVAKNDLGAVAAMMTDKMTVRRLQMEAAEASDDAAEVKDVEEADEDVEEAEAAENNIGTEDLEGMSTKKLIELCGKRGIKVPKYGKNKKFYLEALQGGSDDAEEEAQEEEDQYAGKNAIQLYSLCKKRGLKVKPKQKAAVYLEALKAADAEASDAEDDADDDWDDEVEEEKPAKKSTKKASAKKTTKKAAKKTEPEPEEDDSDDDDDDWEI